MSSTKSSAAGEEQLRRELAAARSTISVLMDRIEQMTAHAQVPSGLNLSSLALQQLVRQRTADLQRLNEGLIHAATQHRRTDRILREMQQMANIGGWELNVENGGIEITDQVLSMLGSPPLESLTVDFFCDFFIAKDAELLRRHLAGAYTKSAPFDLELEARPRDEVQRAFRVVGQPLMEGKTIGSVYGVIKDITKQRAAEFRLAQAQRLESIGQLAAGVAHEINTPTQYVGDNVRFIQTNFATLLTVIGKYSELLNTAGAGKAWDEIRADVEKLMKELDLEFLKEEIPVALSQSLEGLDRVTSIVRAMKDFSHPGSDAKEPADLNRSILSTIEVCRTRWKYVADLQTDLAGDLPLVPCLVAEFNQVMLNLIVNAADAISEITGRDGIRKGHIRISTREIGNAAEIRVQDDGPGIPAALAKRIFDPFFTTKPVGKGTGQGLMLSRNVIVKKHGGDLRFEAAPGGGTVFVITLPIQDPQGESKEAA